MEQLKPCPFCGGLAVCSNEGFMKAGNIMWATECIDCGVVTDFFDKKQDAVNAWNRRAYEEK